MLMMLGIKEKVTTRVTFGSLNSVIPIFVFEALTAVPEKLSSCAYPPS